MRSDLLADDVTKILKAAFYSGRLVCFPLTAAAIVYGREAPSQMED